MSSEVRAGTSAAVMTERFPDPLRDAGAPVGGATWYQPLHWFSNRQRDRPKGHVPIPFSTRTLERGFKSLEEKGLVTIKRTIKRPGGGRFKHPRSVYVNQFAALDAKVVGADEVLTP